LRIDFYPHSLADLAASGGDEASTRTARHSAPLSATVVLPHLHRHDDRAAVCVDLRRRTQVASARARQCRDACDLNVASRAARRLLPRFALGSLGFEFQPRVAHLVAARPINLAAGVRHYDLVASGLAAHARSTLHQTQLASE